MPVEKQVMIIYAATNKYLMDIPVADILPFEKALFEYVDTKYPEVPEAIRTEKVISEETEAKAHKGNHRVQGRVHKVDGRKAVWYYGLDERHKET